MVNKKKTKINKNRDLGLDLFRIMATALVFIHHLGHLCIPDLLKLTKCSSLLNLTKLNLGEIGVSMFIFLSGFTLSRYSIKKRSIKEFYIGRLLRLYIPFWLA